MFNSKQRKIRKFEEQQEKSLRRSLTIEALCALRDDLVMFDGKTATNMAKFETLTEMIHEAWAS